MKFGRALVVAFTYLSLVIPLAAHAQGGMLYVYPEHAVHSVGDVFFVKVLADSDGVAINAAEAELSFNPQALTVEDVSTDGSILTSWSTPVTFSNEKGTIKFSGWTKEKYTGDKGLLVTITFRTLKNMQSNAQLVAGAMLAADGVSSNIITSMRSGVYTAAPVQIDASTSSVEAPAEAATTTDAIPVPAAPQLAPHLIEFPSTLSEGEHIVVKGTATPDSHVTINLSKAGGDQYPTDVVSSSDGSFTFITDAGMKAGEYTLWAVSGDGSGQSDKITITVQSERFAAAVSLAGSFLLDAVPVVALLGLLLLALGHLLHKHRLAKMRQ